jgi:Carboxypeptidase regulatory-like domain/TonB dependent receptor-like, beta-barrel
MVRWVASFWILCFCASLLGQTVSTEILGLVTDPTGAVIPGATVTVKRLATGDVRTVTTNATGNYIFPLLDVGEYEVTCSAPGFKTDVRQGVVLQLQQKARVDFQMEVGAQSEIVEIRGAAPLLRTEDATLGSVVDSKRVVELPLNGRHFGQLATLMPGVTFGVSRIGVDGQGGTPIPGQTVQIAANGQRDIQQHVTMDGVVATEPRINTMSFTPSIEAIEEFKVQSAVYSAEYGMNSGAQVNVAIKSGTNEFHGTVFEFVRNDMFDARGFFRPPDQPKNKLRRNQYGTVLSGPIVHDKTFWLFNWEARRERRATPALASVPTLAMRAGDFSEILQPGNRWYPRDANPAVSRAIRLPGSSTPFPNNIVPPTLINQVSQNLLTWKDKSPFPEGGFLALPNFDAQAKAMNSPLNLTGTNDRNIDSDQLLGRMDHRLGNSDRFFGRYVIVDASSDSIPIDVVSRVITENRSQNVGIGWVRIINPTVLNELRYGYNRTSTQFIGDLTNVGFDQKDLGLDFRVVADGNRTLEPNEEGLPIINITGFSGINYLREPGQLDLVSVHEISDNMTVNRGRHNLKFGGLYRFNIAKSARSNLPRGQMDFTTDIAGVPDGFAAFLLGFPTSSRTAEGQPPADTHQPKVGLYWLDDFKASPRLTVNFGIRWDFFGHVRETEGRLRTVSFDPGQARTINNGLFVPMLVPNPGDAEFALYDINWRQFMPRLGVAYRLTERMVLRAGGGLFYNAQQMNNFQILNLQPPYSGSNLFENDRQNPRATIDNPFAGSATASPAALLMLGNIQASRSNRSMYLNNDIWQWTMEIERSFGQDLVVGIAYLGSKGSNIDTTISNFNNPDPGVGNIQGRRPIQFYADSREPDKLIPLGTLRYLDSGTNSSYHALQARAERRYSRGLTFTGSFNYQKAIGVGYSVNEGAAFGGRIPQDPRNVGAERGRFNLDQRFRFVFSHVWEMPFFRNQKGFKGFVLGGWAINGIVQLTSGLPVNVTQTGDSHNTGAESQPRPHIAPGTTVERVMEGRSLDQWFNTDAFVRSKCDGCPQVDGIFVGPKGYGTAGVNLFDAPGQKTWDFALFKEFRIKEGHRVQLRWESFNFLNTPQFSAPSRSLGSATFGRITSTITDNREMQFGLKYFF